MRTNANEQILLNEFKLSRSDFFEIERMGRKITILRRPGVDKIVNDEDVDMEVVDFKMDVQLVTGFCIATATVHMVGHGKYNDRKSWRSASASPENCLRTNTRYPETAEKRAKHRCILDILGLYELGIETVDMAADFEIADPDKKKNVDDAEKVEKSVESEAKKVAGTPIDEIKESMKKLNEIRKKRKNSAVRKSEKNS